MIHTKPTDQPTDHARINIAIAKRVLGWKIEKVCECDGTMYKECDGVIVPYFSTDIAAAWQVEKRIKELGLTLEYAKELYTVSGADLADYLEETWWIMIHATPFQRCLAALKAVGASIET